MEIITNVDKRYFAYAGGTVIVPLSEMVVDIVENVQSLDREQHALIVADAGIEVPPGVAERELLFLAMSLVQNAWYKETQGAVSEHVLHGHSERLSKFAAAVEEARRRPLVVIPPAGEKPVKAPKEPKSPRGPKSKASFTYEVLSEAVKTNKNLTEALDMKFQPVSHDGIIIQELSRVEAPMTLAELVIEVQATNRYSTNDPLEKSVKWHLGKLVEKGYVKATEVEAAATA